MTQGAGSGPAYICPMHREVRALSPGKCPRCGMALVREDARFGMLRHMFSNPIHLAVMLALMAVLMAASIILTH